MIHVGMCGYCNEGEGDQINAAGKHGHWEGPFKDIETAKLAAIKTKRKTVSECSCCL